MKKTIIISFVCLAVAMFAGYNVYLSNVKTKGLSDLALENVEALASVEPGAVKCGTRTENINTKTACSMDNLYSQGFVGIEYSQLSNGTDYTYKKGRMGQQFYCHTAYPELINNVVTKGCNVQ